MWDVDFQTAVAQAEVEDRPTRGAFHDVAFGVEGGGELVIATTRPELLAACVGVTAHPDDARYQPALRQARRDAALPRARADLPERARRPREGHRHPDGLHLRRRHRRHWWREQRLPLRQIIGRDGRLVPVSFGSDAFPSLDPGAANERYAAIARKGVGGARQAVVEMLRDPAGASATGGAPALRGEPRPIEHAVKFYEKGDRPLEFISTRQWFVRLLDKKDDLLATGDRIRWHPDFMRLRYRNWTENLNVDWCVSRQRYFGVPFPVWYPLDADGRPDHAHPLVADAAVLPVDPTVDVPPGYRAEQRDRPGGFTAEADVFDTWFTSSLTPQIGAGWVLDPERHARLFPADIRPQSHEIIRTWAFYTIAKAMLHERTVPWHHVVISGWILDPDRKKMSKSKGNVVTPMHLLDEYTADGVRYWAASARLGTDTAFDEKVLKVGKRLVTKLYNAGKFVLAQAGPEAAIDAELDRAFVQRLRELVARVSAAFEAFDYAHALQDTEAFFWRDFTDTYLELVKHRARDEAGGSAIAGLRLGLQTLLRLFAPVLPYVTDEVWSWVFAAETGHPSIHRAPWPTVDELAAVVPPTDPGCFDVAVACFAAINKAKSEGGVSPGRGVARLVLSAAPDTLRRLAAVESDVWSAARVEGREVVADTELAESVFVVRAAEYVAAAGG